LPRPPSKKELFFRQRKSKKYPLPLADLRGVFQKGFLDGLFDLLTPHITGNEKQSEERAPLFDVRVYVIVM